jgi:DNA-binding transcriptional MocR family regulator
LGEFATPLKKKIERFLEERSPESFSVSQVAKSTRVSRSIAQRKPKKLLAKGRIVSRGGKFGKKVSRGPGRPEIEVWDVEGIANRVGIDPRVLRSWMEEKKASLAGRDSARTLKKVLRINLEGQPGQEGKERID